MDEDDINKIMHYDSLTKGLLIDCLNKYEDRALKKIEKVDHIYSYGCYCFYENTPLIYACMYNMEKVALKLIEIEKNKKNYDKEVFYNNCIKSFKIPEYVYIEPENTLHDISKIELGDINIEPEDINIEKDFWIEKDFVIPRYNYIGPGNPLDGSLKIELGNIKIENWDYY